MERDLGEVSLQPSCEPPTPRQRRSSRHCPGGDTPFSSPSPLPLQQPQGRRAPARGQRRGCGCGAALGAGRAPPAAPQPAAPRGPKPARPRQQLRGGRWGNASADGVLSSCGSCPGGAQHPAHRSAGGATALSKPNSSDFFFYISPSRELSHRVPGAGGLGARRARGCWPPWSCAGLLSHLGCWSSPQ